ncbi:MAG TPA: bifunctional 2-polyprenyl-6-hydroxyphenol methylase/3-demethylubiquinol 3-O-methyltransferase UbiG [Candidatus Pelagibacter bacterium]|jgi:2-polyprenyl-6-hydroxyphenyl methylase/3-demethylubiquinone-9 3-methyltransferase|nr:bifunctional 2-polyprenyl-6-hydroxyphenol methylase/3-demethylubiquinol 3-O-methyltransferase UbiG [Candidatus Pelagibacter bacterium]|tara:strand:- start:3576 stop:4304 length:729 start_codon:yes stop_codon:yes gene_type:complete
MKTNTINKKEINKFNKLAAEWWNPEGSFKPLHKFNPIRIKYIKENIIRHFKMKPKNMPLKNINILDVGCGGGLISVPMKKLGANVVGIDASLKNINVAKIYSKKNNLEIKYICSSPEKLKIKKKFDVLLMLEIVEHVDDINLFVKQSSKFLKKNGLMFIATLNKTLKSYAVAIVGAEYILNWLPIGTHDWDKFVKPDNLIDIAKNYKLKLIDLSGLKFNPILDKWNLTNDKSVNYIANFRKN